MRAPLGRARLGSVALGGIAMVALPASAAAQSAGSLPPGWRVIADAPADSAPKFDVMAPGWHVTMGPASVIYHPAHTAEDRFALEMEFFFFPGPAGAADGVFVGGESLESSPSFTAFAIRRDGSAGAFRRAGGAVTELRAWASHPAVLAQRGDSVVKNVIRLAAERDSVACLVNGTEVFKVARAAAPMDGVFGLRAGEGTNLHVSRLDLTRHLAEPRARR